MIALSFSGCGGAVSEDQSSDGLEAVDASSAALNELPGRYVGDALSGRSYNLADYERVGGDTVTPFTQSPRFDPMVARGQLMSVEERLPQNPLVVVPWEDAGEHGGELRYFSTSMLGDLYLRHLNEVRLLELGPEAQSTPITKWILGTLEPGVFEHWEQSEDATLFTFRIRRGLKWSDGVEVTSEDARFCIEDAVLNEELYPVAQPWIHWGGDLVEVELIDRYSIRLRFAGSYGLFLPRLVMWRWSWLLLPSHYLKQFHRDYTPMESLLPLMEDEGYAARDRMARGSPCDWMSTSTRQSGSEAPNWRASTGAVSASMSSSTPPCNSATCSRPTRIT